jgi:uncharacterized membrane protein YedE/YeeE
MYEWLFVTPWPWWIAGPAIGLVVVGLALVTGKALGVSTGYGAVCALSSRAEFFRAPEYHETWRLWFLLGLPLGGLLATVLARGAYVPNLAYGGLDALLDGSLAAKAVLLGTGGVLIGAGARWAGGCPSGHSIVGIALGAVSSLVATVSFMVGGLAAFNLLDALLGG